MRKAANRPKKADYFTLAISVLFSYFNQLVVILMERPK